MKNLTRYTLVVRRDKNGFATACGKVRRAGEWVKFSDIEELLQTEEATSGGHSITNTPSKKCYSAECSAIWFDKCTSTNLSGFIPGCITPPDPTKCPNFLLT